MKESLFGLATSLALVLTVPVFAQERETLTDEEAAKRLIEIEKELKHVRSQMAQRAKKIEENNYKLEQLRTALILCETLICRETESGLIVYQSPDKRLWFTSEGTVINIDDYTLVEE